ncbi:TPA: hypothetical protein L5F86_001541 [Pseudomonas aeruginosa]|nr:hypothetical protein [Pseudomonas aeruginosa]
MANLPETPDYPAGIYQLETSDPVLGGAGGIANRQGEQLANRTAWLKAKVDAFIDGTVAVLKATKLATARTLSVSGAASGSASFDGSANANIALTLADSGAVAGTYPKVTINAKGLVTGGAALVAADIPSLDWSKINSGKPTTLAGYGITDALAAGGTAVAAAKLATARSITLSGDLTGSATFDGAANISIAASIVGSVGQVALYAMSSPPTGWLKCNGAAISRTTYADLFAAIGTTFGAGNGSTTFNLPDLRGEFVRGWDDARGVDAGRVFGSAQGDAFKAHFHSTVGNNQYGNLQYIADVTTGGNAGTAAGTNLSTNAAFNDGGGSTETRPRNRALLFCIKY